MIKNILRNCYRLIKIVLFLVLAGLVALLTLTNHHASSVNFLLGARFEAPMIVILLLAFGVGLMIAALWLFPKIWQLQYRLKALQKELNKFSLNHPLSTSHAKGVESDAQVPAVEKNKSTNVSQVDFEPEPYV
jgi:lipopolysaccharide assembly protein A